MIILVSPKISQIEVNNILGKPEFDYYLLLKAFIPTLERIGEVLEVNPDEVDALYRANLAQGLQVVYISAAPPHEMPVGLECPTICLFSWGFESLPDSNWGNDPRNDWRYVFSKVQGAVCTSRQAYRLAHEASSNLPIIDLQPPIWSEFGHLCPEFGREPNLEPRYFSFAGDLIDSCVLNPDPNGLGPAFEAELESVAAPSELSQRISRALGSRFAYAKSLTQDAWRKWLSAVNARSAEPSDNLLGVITLDAPINLQLTGVVYSAVLSPENPHSNWSEIISAFAWTFRDCAEATLVLKMTNMQLKFYHSELLTLLSRLAPFKCRIVVLHGLMDSNWYIELLQASTYYVNASSVEGLCLPLLEFMAAGCPALAPNHSAMADIIDEQSGFVLGGAKEPAPWPHRPYGSYCTYRHRLNWQSLAEAYRASFDLATKQPPDYQLMSAAVSRRIKAIASEELIERDLHEHLNQVFAGTQAQRGER